MCCRKQLLRESASKEVDPWVEFKSMSKFDVYNDIFGTC